MMEKCQNTYIIAEIGNNHNGSVSKAMELIDMSSSSGVDAVKFQSFRGLDIVSPKVPASAYKGWDVTDKSWWYEFLDTIALPLERHQEIIEYAKSRGVDFITTPVSPFIVEYLENLQGIHAYKIASMDLNNYGLINAIAKTKKRTIISTGMGDLAEVDKAVELLGQRDLTILHCVSDYPLEPKDANLKNILALRERFKGKNIGFSDHSLGHELTIAACAMGAKTIEKHVTLDRNDPSPAEHHFSLEPLELTEMVQWVRAIDENMQKTSWARSKNESLSGRNLFRRSFHYNRDLIAGHVLSFDDLVFLRPGLGIGYSDLNDILGHRLSCDVKVYQPCELSHFLNQGD